jgi:hypothetical protein
MRGLKRSGSRVRRGSFRFAWACLQARSLKAPARSRPRLARVHRACRRKADCVSGTPSGDSRSKSSKGRCNGRVLFVLAIVIRTRPPRCSTQRAGIAPPHAEGDGLSGVTSDGGLSGVTSDGGLSGVTSDFISAPASFPDGVPVTRARIPWAMPVAST